MTDYEPRTIHWLGVLRDHGLPRLQPEAADLLAHGWRPEDWDICVRGAELSLLGVGKDLSKAERLRLYEAPEALRIGVLYSVGEHAPPPTYLGTGSGWSWDDRDTAWSPGSGVCADADRRVRLSWRPKTPPYQLDLDLSDR